MMSPISLVSTPVVKKFFCFVECDVPDCLVSTTLIMKKKLFYIQGPSWPRILGRSDFSLQEN